MKQIHALISAAAIAAVTALPVFAQQTPQYTTTLRAGDSALSIAQRVGACGQSDIGSASFDTDSLVRVTCRGGGMAGAEGLSGGLGAAAAGIGAVALIALAADSDGSGSTTTTTTTTTGTN